MAGNSPITTVNISLPESLRSFIEAEVARGSYSSVSEYLRELVRKEQRERAREEVEAKLLQALKSPAKEMSSADWERLKSEVAKRHRRRRT